MNVFTFNFDLLSVGIVISVSIILGSVIYIRNTHSITNITFALFVLATVIWGSINYISYQITDSNIILWSLRLVLFFALLQAYFLFQFFYVFPNEKVVLPIFYKKILLPVVIIIDLLTLTPLVLNQVEGVLASGGASSVKNGGGIILFGLVSIGLVVSAVILLIKKLKKSLKNEVASLRLILIGTVITFSFIITYNFIFPAFLNDPTYISLGAVFFFPFIIFTSYAILKHHLLNIKIIATEILVFLLAFTSLFEVAFANDLPTLIIRLIIFVALLSVGFFLIKSVRNEVQQREKLELLTKELQIANERLKELDQAKTDFLSITSHQLRTPLSAIKGYLSMLEEGDFGKLSKKQTDIISILLRNSERLIRLINIFLNISRIESGRLKINKSPNNLNKLIGDIIKSLQLEADGKHVSLDFKPIDLPKISFDSDKLSDVILNLIDNAIKYTPVGGKVSVSVKSKDKYIVMSIHDNGIGIAYEELDQLFEKFRRGKEINKVDTSGNGLGLYIAKIIITGHGGNIWAESEGEHKGSTFKFTLPLSDKEGVDI